MSGVSNPPSFLAATVWPEPLPDETLYSLVAHTCRLNGWPSERGACSHLFGDHGSLRLGDVLVYMDRFVAETRGLYGGPAEVLARMTHAGFFDRLGSRPGVDVSQPWSPDAGDVVVAPEYRGLATLSNGQAHIWRWCPECNEEDLGRHGRVYWRRTHQLPGVFICTRHGRPLLEANIRYWVRQQHLFLPDNLPEKAIPVPSCPPGADLDQAMALARFAAQVLDTPDEGNSPEAVQGALIDGLLTAGLVTKGGNIRRHEFLLSLTGFYAGLAGVESVAQQLAKGRLNSLTRDLTDSVQSRPAVLNLMLAFWLFGSWELFREHCLWRKAIDSRASAGSISPWSDADMEGENDRTSVQSRHRQVCLDLLHALPQATRTDLWKQNPRSFRWLLQHDSKWIDASLPPARAGANQLALFDNE